MRTIVTSTIRSADRRRFARLAAGTALTAGLVFGMGSAAGAETFGSAPVPERTGRASVECTHLFGSTHICQVKAGQWSAEYVCDTTAKTCIKQ
jgi:hypothetical protein